LFFKKTTQPHADIRMRFQSMRTTMEIKTVTAFLLCSVMVPVSAAVIDFESAPLGHAGTSLTIGEATFTGKSLYLGDYFVGPASLLTRQLCSLDLSLSCGNDLTVTFANPVSNLSLTVDGANLPGSVMVAQLTFGDGSTSAVNFTDFIQFETKTLSFGSLSSIASVTFSNNDPQGFSFDNFSFTSGGTAVPEPSSWALMLSGFAMVGAVRRRTRQDI
jgi:hypothetical protein